MPLRRATARPGSASDGCGLCLLCSSRRVRVYDGDRLAGHSCCGDEPRACGRGAKMSQAAPAIEAPSAGTSQQGNAFWRDALAPYARPHLGRSLLDLVTSVVPYLALSV